MKRVPIQVNDYAGHILSQLPRGILLSSAADGVMDTMTIGWGMLGTDWSLPVFTALVRESRYTHTLLEKNPEFTLSIPLPGSDVRRILGFCGTVSGRDRNKFEEMNLHPVEGVQVKSPALAELPITLECRILYKQQQDPAAIPDDVKTAHYPTGDYHTAYIAQIVDAYLLEDDQ